MIFSLASVNRRIFCHPRAPRNRDLLYFSVRHGAETKPDLITSAKTNAMLDTFSG